MNTTDNILMKAPALTAKVISPSDARITIINVNADLSMQEFQRTERQNREIGGWMLCHSDLLVLFRDKHAKTATYWDKQDDTFHLSRMDRKLVDEAQERIEELCTIDDRGNVYI